MEPGCDGKGVTLILLSLHELLPHEFLALTLIVPPLAPAVVLILVVVELPLQPEGSCHSYDVAPETGEIL